MRGVLLVSTIAMTGCSSILGIDDFKLGDAGGGGGDEGVPGDGREFCLGPDGWRVCLASPPTNATTLANPNVFNTDSDPSCLADQPMSWKLANQSNACFVVASAIAVDASFAMRVTGTRPLVLVAVDKIQIDGGGLDVGSHANLRGPGATDAGCMPPTAAQDGPNGTTAAGGGGAGGTVTSRGGPGGNSSSAGVAGGSPAAPVAPAALAVLRGGCSGGGGGRSGNGNAGGIGGAGGGAVYLLAGNQITINAAINASGTGGQPGGLLGGGGGGGSGGMIVLHAPTVGSMNGRGVVVANGGGGASGSGPQITGKPGDDPDPFMPMFQAAGGANTGGGGAGGRGFAGGTLATGGDVGAPTSSNAGGGGGGGGGYIRSSNALDPASNGVTSSPVPVITQ